MLRDGITSVERAPVIGRWPPLAFVNVQGSQVGGSMKDCAGSVYNDKEVQACVELVGLTVTHRVLSFFLFFLFFLSLSLSLYFSLWCGMRSYHINFDQDL